MKLILKSAIILILITFSFSLVVQAQVNTDLVSDAAGGAGFDTSQSDETIAQRVGAIISIILSFVGTIFFILVIVSGIQWMTAGGNEEKVTKARTRLVQASIGLAITVAAYFITWFISNTLGAV